MSDLLHHLIKDGEPVRSRNDAWSFERSSGFAGYRNSVTGEWVYADQLDKAPATLVENDLTYSLEKEYETCSRTDSNVPF